MEMTFLRSMEQYGLDVPIRQAGLALFLGSGLVPQLELTLTADHRAVDGVVAGRFLVAVRSLLEGGEI